MAATTAKRFEKAPLWRLLAVLVLLAFSFQSYVAQTHIHDAAAPATLAAIHHTGHGQGHGKSPVENSPLDCPFCQVVTHAGHVLMSDAPLLFLASQWVELAAPYHLFADTGAAAHHPWQSRAPPSR